MVERKATQQPHRTVDVGTRADKSSVRAYTTMSAFLQEKASSIEPKVSSVAQDEKIAAEFVASNHADPTESVETSLLKVRGYIQHTFNRDLVLRTLIQEMQSRRVSTLGMVAPTIVSTPGPL